MKNELDGPFGITWWCACMCVSEAATVKETDKTREKEEGNTKELVLVVVVVFG